MTPRDLPAFTAMLDDIATIVVPPQPLTSTGTAMFFRALAAVPLDRVRAALDAHLRDPGRGRFFPRPADVFAQLASSDGRPAPEEAWAIAVRALDERASVVWTDEAAEAWAIAKPLLVELRDKVAAHAAFVEAYERIVAAARKATHPPTWFASLGHDPEGRIEALREEARMLGKALPLLEAPLPQKAAPLLPDGVRVPDDVREKLAAIADRFRAGAEPGDELPSEDASDKRRTRELQADTQRQVDAYRREHGVST